MSKFIVPGTYSDGCTYSSDVFVAVECESVEKIYSDLMDAINLYVSKKNANSKLDNYEDMEDLKSFQHVVVCGSNFDLDLYVYLSDRYCSASHKARRTIESRFVFFEPSIIPLEDWFEEQKTTISFD